MFFPMKSRPIGFWRYRDKTHIYHNRLPVEVVVYLHPVFYGLERLEEGIRIAYTVFIQHLETLDLCIRSKITHNTGDRQAMICHRETDEPPIDIFSCFGGLV